MIWTHAAPLLAVLPLLLLATPALADDPTDAASSFSAIRQMASSRSVGVPGMRPSAIHPVGGLHTQAYPTARVGLFAEGFGFALTRRAATYHLEGGAALRLDARVRLTASYRLVGIDLGFDSDVEGADGGPGIAAPFLGVALDF